MRNIIYLIITLLLLNISGCIGNNKNEATTKSEAIKIFNLETNPDITTSVNFVKLDTYGTPIAINKNNLDDISNIFFEDRISENYSNRFFLKRTYSKSGNLLSQKLVPARLEIAVLFKTDIQLINTADTPSNIYKELLNQCSTENLFKNQIDLKKYSITKSLSTLSTMYIFNIHPANNNEYEENDCFQSIYIINNNQATCVTFPKLKCVNIANSN